MTWPTKPLSSLCLLAIDCVNKTAPVVEGPTPYKMIRTTNVKGGFIDVETVRYVSQQTYEQWTRRSRPIYGDVVLTREAPVGEVGRCTFPDTEQIFLGQRLFQYRANPELLDWNYLAYALQSPFVQNKLHAVSFGATVPHIKVGDAEHLEIPYPPLATQKVIGDTLAAYDDLIENNRRRIALLEESARLLYREWFVDLRFPGCGPFVQTTGLPIGWRHAHLEEALFLQRGFDLPSASRVPEAVPIYASAGIVGYHNQAMAAGPGVVTGRSGTLGAVHFVDETYWPLNTALWVKEFRAASPAFAYFLLLEMNLAQYNSGSSVPTLDRKVVHAQPVVIPAAEAIAEFEARASVVFAQIKILRASTAFATEARNALLPKLMSGEIAV